MKNKVNITIVSEHVNHQSNIQDNQYVFTYTVTIKNNLENSFQLISRHWLITDANNKTEEVYGKGVIGEQPIIKPGQEYSYSSFTRLETEMGTMEGRYFMRLEDGTEFDVAIPKFLVSIHRVLH